MASEITKQKDMALMGIESSHDFDDFVNRHEEKLFEWKQDVLQKLMVPALIRKKLSPLSQLVVAEDTLSLASSNNEPSTDLPELSSSNKIDFLETYESKLSSLKLQLMNTASFRGLEQILQAIIDWQELYMQRFLLLFSEYSEALPEEVNSREIIDTGKLLMALKQEQLDNKVIWSIEREISRIKKIR
jgi:hypothetical protein